jgi:DNA-binding HxlR family transcriptional regulator
VIVMASEEATWSNNIIARTDVVGDRWTLLIVRELLTRPSRYSDLRDGLPGIATNLLADRLRQLEADGVVRHDAGTGVYELTEWGLELRPAVQALMRWAVPTMRSGRGGDEFRPHWLPLAIGTIFKDATVEVPTVVEVRVDGEPATIAAGADGVQVTLGTAAAPDAVVEGGADGVLGVLSGVGPPDSLGVQVTGSKRALRRLVATTG